MLASRFNQSIRSNLFLIVGATLLAWFEMTTLASAGKLLYRCEGLEEKSRMTSIAVKMYQGYDGWFFREGDMENMYELSPQALNAFKNVAGALRYRGIHLVLLPMLPRGVAGRDFVPNDGIFSDMFYDPAFSKQQFGGMVKSLRDAGVDTVDITEIRDQRPDFDWNTYYLKRDIHWTPEGARVVASALAEKIISLIGDIPVKAQFETEVIDSNVPIRFNMGKALNEVCQDKIPGESVTGYSTKRSVESLDALIGDSEAPGQELVHVVGTSFTDERMDFNFNGFLRQALEHDVSGYSIAGGGLTQSIYGWTQNANGLIRKPQVLIWEYSDLQSVLQSVNYIDEAIVPAIVGDCDGEFKLSEKVFDNANTFEFDLPTFVDKVDDYYLAYNFSNRALTSFQSIYTFENGSKKKLAFENPNRVSGLSKLYQALPSGLSGVPVNVRLAFGQGAKSAGSVKVCRYPAGIFQDQPTSNKGMSIQK